MVKGWKKVDEWSFCGEVLKAEVGVKKLQKSGREREQKEVEGS